MNIYRMGRANVQTPTFKRHVPETETWRHHKNKKACQPQPQLTRFQVWPPQNIPPKAQPCTRIAFGPFMAIVES